MVDGGGHCKLRRRCYDHREIGILENDVGKSSVCRIWPARWNPVSVCAAGPAQLSWAPRDLWSRASYYAGDEFRPAEVVNAQ